MTIPLLSAEYRWNCPNCPATKLTREARPHTPFHPCAGLAGLMVPFVKAGTKCKVEAVEREDYTNGDLVQKDGNGRVVMATVITRENGQDRIVYAPTARLKGSG